MRWNAITLSAVALSGALFASPAAAEWALGWALGYTRLDIDDPDGPTKPGGDASLINALFTTPMGRDGRVLVQLYSDEVETDASTTEIGQTVESTGLLVSYQALFRLSTIFKPWVGIGGGVSTDSYTKRYIVDSSGFLAGRYPDRDETNTHLLVNAADEWKVGDSGNIGWLLQFRHSVSSGDNQAGFYVYYTYTLGR